MYWDREAPYGTNGYAEHTGRDVTVPFERSMRFATDLSAQCEARGVAETADGTVYVLTERRKGWEDTASGRRHLATYMRGGTFADHARALLTMERDYITSAAFAKYTAWVDTL